MNSGIIFNIQKFSIHDGPGIRTTVFFKGCPLRCQWCSNPESQLQSIQILYDKANCIHCQTCLLGCEQNAISMLEQHIHIDVNRCVACLQCVQHCPQNALRYEGYKKTVQEVVNLCLQDRDFYDESNGGVTLSGGEAMYQSEFITALIKELKKADIHVAMETTGFINPSIFQKISPLLDLLLFDVKHYHSQKHFEGTGVHNDIIIQNIHWAIQHSIDVLPRIPVIPGFNNSLEDAIGLADLLLSVGAKQVQLLPFHQFGEKKYELLNSVYMYKDKKALHREDLIDYQQIFLNKGLDCFF